MRYLVLIDGEPGAYGVVFPDLPGCTAMGETVDEALISAASAAREWSQVVELAGESVPAPREISELRRDPDVTDALAEGSVLGYVLLIREPGRKVKANMTIDANILAAIDAGAARTERTRSAMVEALAQVGLSLVG